MAGETAGHLDSNLDFSAENQWLPTSWKSSWLGTLTVLLRMSPPRTRADA
jgi:hypothetical protein